jgi:tetratricopeptide (TPR) repeat protein
MQLASRGELARRAIARLDGRVPLGQILGECAGDPLAASTLWLLLHAGILRIGGRPAGSAEIPKLEFEVEVSGATVNSTGVDDTHAAGPASTNAAVEEKSAALRSEIEGHAAQLRDLDHYSALGLDAEANAVDIKKAYFKAAKKYHPDSLARMGLDDLKESAARVFARMAEAFETLSNPDKRAAYDAGGGDAPEIDAARLAQAEKSYRKGEILVRMGNFQGALEYLGPAVDLWPEEPAYQSGLGWALYKQPKRDVERALEHLEIALGLAPDEAVLNYRLGVILRAHGDTERAQALIARAHTLDPSLDS